MHTGPAIHFILFFVSNQDIHGKSSEGTIRVCGRSLLLDRRHLYCRANCFCMLCFCMLCLTAYNTRLIFDLRLLIEITLSISLWSICTNNKYISNWKYCIGDLFNNYIFVSHRCGSRSMHYLYSSLSLYVYIHAHFIIYIPKRVTGDTF